MDNLFLNGPEKGTLTAVNAGPAYCQAHFIQGLMR